MNLAEGGAGFFPINFAVWEARSAEQGQGKLQDSLVRERLHSFAYAHPYRIYYNPDVSTVVGLVVIFSELGEETPRYGAYMETLVLDRVVPDSWLIQHSKTVDSRENGISGWRKRLGVSRDLVGEPSAVYQVAGSDDQYIHVGETKQGFLTWGYVLTKPDTTKSGGLPMTNRHIQLQPHLNFPGVDLIKLEQPSQELHDYVCAFVGK